MRGPDVLDMQIEVDLLLQRPVGPPGRDAVRRELHAEPPLAVDDHAMKVVVLIDRATQETRPERAQGTGANSRSQDRAKHSRDAFNRLLSRLFRR